MTRAWDETGTELWTTLIPIEDSGVLGLTRIDEGDYVASGYHPGPNGFLARYETGRGMEVWAQLQVTAGALGPIAGGDRFWVSRADTDALERYTLDGMNESQISPLDGDEVMDVELGEDGHVYVLTLAMDRTSFAVSHYDAQGGLMWTQVHDDGALVDVGGLALLPAAGGLVVAGSTNVDLGQSDGLLVWYDLGGEQLAPDLVLDIDEVDALHDVAVTPFSYALAVGERRVAGQDSDLWIRKFEI